jgi:4-carboxymuconolactone decarboxylase
MTEPQGEEATELARFDTGRITIPAPDEMTTDQRKIYDATIAYLGGPYGPRIALLNRPAIALRWSEMLSALEASALDARLWSLTILIIARHWTSQFIWWAHVGRAEACGLPVDAIEALRVGDTPRFDKADEAALHDYLTQLLGRHSVTDATYAAAVGLIGTDALVDLTVLAGHYNSVAMTLAAHRMPLPPGAKALLPLLPA